MSVEAIAQAQLDAYNAQDLDAYCAFYTDDVVIADVGGAVSTEGNAALRERYAGAFAKFPKAKFSRMRRIRNNLCTWSVLIHACADEDNFHYKRLWICPYSNLQP